jgi:hypothetical protein
MQDLRTEMVLTMEALGIQIEAHHHEVATAGQAEIDMRFTTLTRMADNLMMYKYVVKNVARKHGMTATFMPKPLFEDNADDATQIRLRDSRGDRRLRLTVARLHFELTPVYRSQPLVLVLGVGWWNCSMTCGSGWPNRRAKARYCIV